MVTVALDRCPRCGATLLADYDLDLRCQMPFCLCCGFKRYPRRAVSPLIVVAKRLESSPDDDDMIDYHEIEEVWHVARSNVWKAIRLGQLTVTRGCTGNEHQLSLFRRGDVRKWREIMVAAPRGRPRNARPDDLLSADDVVDELGFCRDNVSKAVKVGKLAPVDATAYRHQYRRSDVDAWRESVQGAHQRAEATKRANKAKKEEAHDDNDCD